MMTELKDLYFDQIRDLYSAETQLLEALPKMASAAENEDLREALSAHLEETRKQQERLSTICSRHNINPGDEVCDAMRGLIKEGEKHLSEAQVGPVRDAVIIASGNRVEHYEIAGYGVAKAFGQLLDFHDDVELLKETENEEAAADKLLTKIATGGLFSGGVNKGAVA